MKDESVQAISGPDPELSAARRAAIQTPDAQERNTPEHPMVSYARNLLDPLTSPYASRALPFNPYPTQALPSPIASDSDPPIPGARPGEVFKPNYDFPVLGGINRVVNSPLARVFQPSPEDQGNPLFALGPVGELAGPTAGATEAITSKLGQGARELVSGKLPNFATETGGHARVDLGALGPERYKATILKDSTAAVVDESGTVVQTAKTYKEAVAQAEARNAAPAAEEAAKAFAVSPEVQVQAALRNVPRDVGTVIRQAARAMPEMSAQTLTETPALRSHLDLALARAKMPATDENVASLADALLSQERARPTVGNRNAQAVREALGAVKPPTSVPPSAEQAAAQARVTTAAQAQHGAGLAADVARQTDSFDALVGDAGKPPPPGGRTTGATPGGGMPPDAPLPTMPTRGSAGQMAGDLALEVNALFRGAMAGADLSTVLLQGAPLLVKDISKLPFYAVEAARGGAQRPYFQSAFARLGQAAVAGPERMRAITQGLMDTAERAGLRPGVDVKISDPLGPLAAREELSAGSIIQKIPGIGLLYRQGNFATITFLNAMRVGEAVNLKRAYTAVGLPFDAARVGHFVNIATGVGDLPFGIEEGSKAAKVMQGLFFGPRLMSAAVQNVTDNIAALGHIGSAVLSRRPIPPVDIARIHTTAAFVTTGWGLLQIAQASGLAVGTDPEKTDFGRITLPGGHRIDFWGPFNEEARLIAREIGTFNRTTLQGKKPSYGAPTTDSLLKDYLRSKLGPLASAGYSVATGANQAGQTPADVIQSTLANPNPLANPESMVPAPFTAQTVAQAFNPTQGGQGGAQGVAESVLGTLGVSVLPPRQHIPADGLGRPETHPQYGHDAIFDEYGRLFPGKTLDAPDATLGSGKNTFPLPPTEREKYIAMVGDARRVALGRLIYSESYQNENQAQQEKDFKQVQAKADADATRAYLRSSIISATDPAQIRAEAVTGFHAQGGVPKNEAYWIAALDKAGKLTPDVKRAIDESNVTLPGKVTPITADEYLKAAPLVHEYLAHVPYGTDAHPIGTPEDWTAVSQAHDAKDARKDALVRSGMNPSLADATAQRETLAQLTSLVQRNIYLNAAQLENPARKALAIKYAGIYRRILGTSPTPAYQESEAPY